MLYVHPFAEEMNKSRRMAALQSRALAKAGFAVLQIDLLGCGDSTGDSSDAQWDRWIDDLAAAHEWLRKRADGPFWFWGLRAGCLLAADAAAQIKEEDSHFLFWQPASAGKPLIQQFLRLKTAGEMIGGATKGAVETLRRQLAQGEAIEVAGYALAPQLVQGFDQATLAPPAGRHPQRRVEWIEVSTRDGATLLPASTVAVERWCAAGFQVRTRIVPGPAFWQTTEIEEAPELIDATLAALAAAPAGAHEAAP